LTRQNLRDLTIGALLPFNIRLQVERLGAHLCNAGDERGVSVVPAPSVNATAVIECLGSRKMTARAWVPRIRFNRSGECGAGQGERAADRQRRSLKLKPGLIEIGCEQKDSFKESLGHYLQRRS
jgi:hypothetical protein